MRSNDLYLDVVKFINARLREDLDKVEMLQLINLLNRIYLAGGDTALKVLKEHINR